MRARRPEEMKRYITRWNETVEMLFSHVFTVWSWSYIATRTLSTHISDMSVHKHDTRSAFDWFSRICRCIIGVHVCVKRSECCRRRLMHQLHNWSNLFALQNIRKGRAKLMQTSDRYKADICFLLQISLFISKMQTSVARLWIKVCYIRIARAFSVHSLPRRCGAWF